MVRGWILVEMNNGTDFRYVRDQAKKYRTGDSYEVETGAEYYTYHSGDTGGDTADTFYATSDTPGRILYDYNTLTTSLIGDSYVLFPESGGATHDLRRRNYDMPGDTEGAKCYNVARVLTSAVSHIRIIEEVAPTEVLIG